MTDLQNWTIDSIEARPDLAISRIIAGLKNSSLGR
jgi:hypothetical protein